MASPSIPEALHSLRARASASSATLRALKQQVLAQQEQNAPIGHTPSGPRRKGEGVNDEQGILAAEALPGSAGARLRISLLAAGFVLGPSGCSVRDIISTSAADIRSWTEYWQAPAGGEGAAAGSGGSRATKIRTFVIEGTNRAVVRAINIIHAAVDRYNELCGGLYNGKAVDRTQVIEGVAFFYSPPPRSAVAWAASLKSGAEQAMAEAAPARKTLFASPPSNKENYALPAFQPLQPLGMQHQPAAHRMLSMLGSLPATPAAAAATGADLLLPQLAGLLPGLGQAMALDSTEAEVATPAYSTVFGAHGAGEYPGDRLRIEGIDRAGRRRLLDFNQPTTSQPSTLSAGGVMLAHETCLGSNSSFASAFECTFATPTAPSYSSAFTSAGVGRQLFADTGMAAATPAVPQLHRQLSGGSDALLTSSASAFQAGGGGIWGTAGATAPASVMPQLQPAALLHSGLPPLQQHAAIASGGGSFWGQLPAQQGFF
ncbi:hypothetical protein ABPG75_004162 [Micractinium tetrahymenae]